MFYFNYSLPYTSGLCNRFIFELLFIQCLKSTQRYCEIIDEIWYQRHSVRPNQSITGIQSSFKAEGDIFWIERVLLENRSPFLLLRCWTRSLRPVSCLCCQVYYIISLINLVPFVLRVNKCYPSLFSLDICHRTDG